MKRSRYLKPGERFTMEGKTWEVERVNECAATVREIHVNPERVQFSGRDFVARKGRRTTISPTALVQRV
jgi:hypothetical protein